MSARTNLTKNPRVTEKHPGIDNVALKKPNSWLHVRAAYILEPLLYWWPYYNYNYKQNQETSVKHFDQWRDALFIHSTQYISFFFFQSPKIFTLWSFSFFVLQFDLSKLFSFVTALGNLFSMHAYRDLKASRKCYVARLSLDFIK